MLVTKEKESSKHTVERTSNIEVITTEIIAILLKFFELESCNIEGIRYNTIKPLNENTFTNPFKKVSCNPFPSMGKIL